MTTPFLTPLLAAALLTLAACGGTAEQAAAPRGPADAAKALHDLSADAPTRTCMAAIREIDALVGTLAGRLATLEQREREGLAIARTREEESEVYRLHSYDVGHVANDLTEPMDLAKARISVNCPPAATRIAAIADGLPEGGPLKQDLAQCAATLRQLGPALSRQVPDPWSSTSADVARCPRQLRDLASAIEPPAAAPTPGSASPAAEALPEPMPSATPTETPEAALQDADRELNRIWVAIRPNYSDAQWAALRQRQRQWIRERDAACKTDRQCLLARTRERSGWLEAVPR